MERAKLEKLKAEIVRRYRKAFGSNLVALAFFGSWARGEEREGSDIDVLLIARELPRCWSELRKAIWKPLDGFNGDPIAILARTVEEFSADVSPLHLDLAADAIVIYDTDDFLSSKLNRVRELIEEAGLERKRMSKGILAWWWKREVPKPGWALTWEGFKP